MLYFLGEKCLLKILWVQKSYPYLILIYDKLYCIIKLITILIGFWGCFMGFFYHEVKYDMSFEKEEIEGVEPNEAEIRNYYNDYIDYYYRLNRYEKSEDADKIYKEYRRGEIDAYVKYNFGWFVSEVEEEDFSDVPCGAYDIHKIQRKSFSDCVELQKENEETVNFAERFKTYLEKYKIYKYLRYEQQQNLNEVIDMENAFLKFYEQCYHEK